MTTEEKKKLEKEFKFELDDGEIMRLSIRKSSTDPDNYETICNCNGPQELMKLALSRICMEHFDMICIPKEAMLGMGILGMPNLSDLLDFLQVDDE